MARAKKVKIEEPVEVIPVEELKEETVEEAPKGHYVETVDAIGRHMVFVED